MIAVDSSDSMASSPAGCVLFSAKFYCCRGVTVSVCLMNALDFPIQLLTASELCVIYVYNVYATYCVQFEEHEDATRRRIAVPYAHRPPHVPKGWRG